MRYDEIDLYLRAQALQDSIENSIKRAPMPVRRIIAEPLNDLGQLVAAMAARLQQLENRHG